ncbi:MAG TPA: NAD-dependent deacylase [Natronosporangium sp.]
MERRRTEPPGLKPGDPVAELARLLEQHRGRAVALTGAGVSVASGIPAFRGRDGLWSRFDPEEFAHIDAFRRDPERVWSMLDELYDALAEARPNRAHQALARLEEMGCLRAVITQNIDGLHQAAGSDPDLVLELHGTVHWVRCLSCDRRTPMREVLERVRAGEADPPCLACGGIQKSATVSFGEALDPAVLAAAVRASRDCDLFIAAGTSLSVYPAAGLCEHALAAGARLVILNAQPTPYDPVADAVVRTPLGEVLPRLVAHVAPTDAPA